LVAAVLVSDLVLFQLVTAPGTTALRNNGLQIRDVLSHVLAQYSAQGMAAPFVIGTIDPAVALGAASKTNRKADSSWFTGREYLTMSPRFIALGV
jgi:hypothetical protein